MRTPHGSLRNTHQFAMPKLLILPPQDEASCHTKKLPSVPSQLNRSLSLIPLLRPRVPFDAAQAIEE